MKKLAFAVTAASGAAAALSHHDAEASTQHKVQSGESLWTIAQKYNTSVDSIKQNNNLDNNMVFPGQVITVGGSASQSSSSNTSSQSGSPSTHTVQSGESLNIIANKYGVSVNELMSANNLNGYLITPNQTLKFLTAVLVQAQALVLVVQQLHKVIQAHNHHHLTIKIYILKDNVHGTYLTVVLKLVNQLAHIGQMLNIGLLVLRMTVTK